MRFSEFQILSTFVGDRISKDDRDREFIAAQQFSVADITAVVALDGQPRRRWRM